MYPIGEHSVVYVTIRLLFDNTERFRLLLVSGCVCVYHVQLLDPLAGSPKHRNGWQNIISGAGAGQLAGLSWPTQGWLVQ